MPSGPSVALGSRRRRGPAVILAHLARSRRLAASSTGTGTGPGEVTPHRSGQALASPGSAGRSDPVRLTGRGVRDRRRRMRRVASTVILVRRVAWAQVRRIEQVVDVMGLRPSRAPFVKIGWQEGQRFRLCPGPAGRLAASSAGGSVGGFGAAPCSPRSITPIASADRRAAAANGPALLQLPGAGFVCRSSWISHACESRRLMYDRERSVRGTRSCVPGRRGGRRGLRRQRPVQGSAGGARNRRAIRRNDRGHAPWTGAQHGSPPARAARPPAAEPLRPSERQRKGRRCSVRRR